MKVLLALVFLISLFSINSAKPTPLGCDVCKAGAIILFSNKTADETEALLDRLCEALPVGETFCLSLVERLVTVYRALENFITGLEELTPTAICTMISECNLDCCISEKPEQVHLSLTGNASEIGVVWVTRKNTESVVRYGKSSGNWIKYVPGITKTYTDNVWLGWIHNVVLKDLEPNTRYFYQVGDLTDDGWSNTFSFITQKNFVPNDPIRIAVIGDMGRVNSYNTIERLTSLVTNHEVDFILHVGDVSYADGYQARWDDYFRTVEKFAANIPYMVTVGNHEIGIIASLNLPVGYVHRFILPGNYSQTTDYENLFYSFNYGPIHWVSLDTESILDVAQMTDKQLLWLENDLKSVDRTKYPWLIVFAHRPLYCSEEPTSLNPDCTGFAEYLRERLENLLVKYKVDLVFTAHRHNYERMWPVYNSQPVKTYNNPGLPVYIVNGAAGNREGLEPLNDVNPPSYSAARVVDFGYAVLKIFNSTVLTHDFYLSRTDVRTDSFTLNVNHE